MATNPQAQPQWFWDQAVGEYFSWDWQRQSYVYYPSGRSRPEASNVPRVPVQADSNLIYNRQVQGATTNYATSSQPLPFSQNLSAAGSSTGRLVGSPGAQSYPSSSSGARRSSGPYQRPPAASNHTNYATSSQPLPFSQNLSAAGSSTGRLVGSPGAQSYPSTSSGARRSSGPYQRPPAASNPTVNQVIGSFAAVTLRTSDTDAPIQYDFPNRWPATHRTGSNARARQQGQYRSIQGPDDGVDPLDSRFRRQPATFFRLFRVRWAINVASIFTMLTALSLQVFKAWWPESAGGIDDNATPVTLTKNFVKDRKHGQWIYSKIRWFVVVKEGVGYCLCLPIVTYGRRATAKPTVVKNEHCIVYTGDTAPDIIRKPAELNETPTRGERPMRRPIKILSDDPEEKLDELSRLHYARMYTVEHNVKAMAFGWLHQESQQFFLHDWNVVQTTTPGQPVAATPDALDVQPAKEGSNEGYEDDG